MSESLASLPSTVAQRCYLRALCVKALAVAFACLTGVAEAFTPVNYEPEKDAL